jgi:hypothetical protein
MTPCECQARGEVSTPAPCEREAGEAGEAGGAMQKHLQAFLEKNIESNSEMLVKLSDPTLLVDWATICITHSNHKL